MLGLPALVAGLILDLAGSSWFPGASTVGTILIVIGAVVIGFYLLVFALAAFAVSR